jgi:hypothetical protein
MHPLIVYEAVRAEQARRIRQARSERASRTREAAPSEATTGDRTPILDVLSRSWAAIGRRIGAVVRGRTPA